MTPPPPTPAAEVRTVQVIQVLCWYQNPEPRTRPGRPVAGRATDRPTVQWERGLALVRCRDWPARLRGPQIQRTSGAAHPGSLSSEHRAASRTSTPRDPPSVPGENAAGLRCRCCGSGPISSWRLLLSEGRRVRVSQ
ncbi:hypothetical protein INR49_005086 [Caranx melampygus]|nr:hypothetical protein INR49_005086 [Caranx melampygus]